MLLLLLLSPLSKSQFDAAHHVPRVTDAAARLPYERKYGGNSVSECVLTEPIRQEDSVHEIFLVPHTHDDVGWLYTVGGYYNRSVHAILDTVTADLASHPHHRFIWSEIKWIEMWWPQQNTSTRNTFRRIVASGQLEFVGAGWSQHDEVTPSYRDMASNTATGHEFLRQILGPLDRACPKAGGRCIRFGWQIDMFAGYSAASPSLNAMLGYDGMVLRFEGPPEMRAEWDRDQDYEFIWAPSAHLSPKRSRVATHVMRWNYGDMLLTGRNGSAYGYRGPDVSFAFDHKKLHTQADIERYATALVRWSKGRGAVYRGNRHLAAWGSDFQFTDAGLWFSQMDQLITEINGNVQKYGAHIRYSTLAGYFDHLHALNAAGDPAAQLPLKPLLDFQYGWPHTWSPIGVPLIGLTANFSWQYQTGAAASRPAHKQRVRSSAARLRTAQAAHAIALASGALNASMADEFWVAWDALGLAQHHDSLPGTMQTAESVSCPDNVAIVDGIDACTRTTDPSRLVLEDYSARLDEADAASSAILLASLEAIDSLPSGSLSFAPTPLPTNTTLAADLTAAAATATSSPDPADEGRSVVHPTTVRIFNPSAHTRVERVRVEFSQPKATPSSSFFIPTVYSMPRRPLGQTKRSEVTAQIEVNDQRTTQLTNSHHPPVHWLNSALYFLATVPPLASVAYSLEYEMDAARNQLINSSSTAVPTLTVGAAAVARTGLGYKDDPSCLHVSFNSADGLMQGLEVGCANATKASARQTYLQYVDAVGGAYCLIEQTSAVELAAPFRVALTRGPVFEEVVQNWGYGYGLQQRVRVVRPTASASVPTTVEVEHSSGRLAANRELISRITTDLCSGGTVFTEASGFSELYPRPLNRTASIAQNYHSLVQTAAIRDSKAGCPPPPTLSGAKGEATAQKGEVPMRPAVVRQLSVLTRRTMGVASLFDGAVEYMTMRRISTQSDNQGPWPLDDSLPMHDLVRILLAPVAESEAARFPLALALEHPFSVLYMDRSDKEGTAGLKQEPLDSMARLLEASSFVKAAAQTSSGPSPTGMAPLRGFPPSVWSELLVRAKPPLNATYAIRLQNVVAGSAPVVIPSLSEALGISGMVACVETTLSLQESRAANEAIRLEWRAQGEDTRRYASSMPPTAVTSAPSCARPIQLDSLDIRSFTFDIHTAAH